MEDQEKLDELYGYNPIENENPCDALAGISSLTRFINEAIGGERREIELTTHGKEGLQYYLNFMEGSTRQIADTLEKGNFKSEKKEVNKKITNIKKILKVTTASIKK